MKKCFKCGLVKAIDEYYKHPQMADGHLGKCKNCTKDNVRTNYSEKRDKYREYDAHRQRHSITRILNHRYSQIRQRVEGRAIRDYGVRGKGVLTREEWEEWTKSNMDTFNALYSEWKSNGFTRGLTPSIDRVNNDLSYTQDNIRWITLSENAIKGTRTI